MRLSKASESVHKYIFDNPAPVKGMTIDIAEYAVGPQVGVRVYREELEEMPESVRQNMISWLIEMLSILNLGRTHAVYTLEVEGERP